MTVAPSTSPTTTSGPPSDRASVIDTTVAVPPRRGRTGTNTVAGRLAARVHEASAGLDEILVWRPRNDRLRRGKIGPHCRDLCIETSYPIRLEYRWQGRHAFSGERWFSHTRESLHYESMTERLGLIQLEYHFNRPDLPTISAAATQPMLIVRRGIKRFPDFMLRFSDDQRWVVDVKRSADFTPEVLEALQVTREVCDLIGWRYVLLVEPEPVVEFNLELLSARRHPEYAPGPEMREAVVQLCRQSRPLGEVVDALAPGSRGAVIGYLHHLMWTRVIDPVTLRKPLEWDTHVLASPHQPEQ